jgi:outer membrane lipoprotein-sorting protein
MKTALMWICGLTLALTSHAALALDGEAILREVDRNLQPESFESYRKLVNIEPDGKQREYTLFTVKKGHDKIASLFIAPASEKGRATLRLGDNMWLYIPNVAKPVRVTSLQSVIGGLFNNADILRLDYSVEYDVKSIEEAEDTYVLDLKAKTGLVAYDRLKMTVDKKDMVPTEIGCYAASGMLIKTLHFKEIKAFDDGARKPAVTETDSPLYKGYRSLLILAKMKKKDFSDEAFTLNFLPKLESLR